MNAPNTIYNGFDDYVNVKTEVINKNLRLFKYLKIHKVNDLYFFLIFKYHNMPEAGFDPATFRL